MNAIPLWCDGHRKIRVINELYGNIIIDPDQLSIEILEQNPLIKEVQGYIIKETRETSQGIKFNAWIFHIESFTGC